MFSWRREDEVPVEVAGRPEEERRAQEQPGKPLGPNEHRPGEAQAAGCEQQAVVDPVVEETIDAPLRTEERFDGERADDDEQGCGDHPARAQIDPSRGLLPISVVPHGLSSGDLNAVTEYRVGQARWRPSF